MMTTLDTLYNICRPKKKRTRVGRGAGSGLGKTCGRGQKGAGARAGYKRRYGYEGGQFRTFMKMPIRGFSNARFRREITAINLDQVNDMFEDGEVVSAQTLFERRYTDSPKDKIKLLGNGTLKKKVTFKVDAISEGAKEKLRHLNVSV